MSVSPELSPLPSPTLAALRRELDGVDDALHDLLMRRAEVVARVAALRAKDGTPLRPGREAAIIRRLLGRNGGDLAPALLVRVWREMIMGFTVLQQDLRPVVVAGAALREVAVRHFGLLVGLEVAADEAAALARVGAGTAGAAVLRWPGSWWTALLDGTAAGRVVGRLPFWGSGAEAMVVTLAAPDPSGEDETLVAARMPGPALASGLAQAGFGGVTLLAEHGGAALAALDGFVAAEDQRLASVRGAAVIGAYAVPVGEGVVR